MSSLRQAWLLGAVMFMVVASPSPLSGQGSRHGALAIDRNDGERYGWAIDYASQAEADARALAECSTRDVTCHIVLQFSGGCGAYVVERGNRTLYGWGTNQSRGEAEARARQEARARGGVDLVLRVWGCNSTPPDSTGPSEAERLRAELEAARQRRAREAEEAAAAERARLQEELRAARERREQLARDEASNGRLIGRVTDALTRAGIGGATVVLEGPGGSYSASTGPDGSYRSGLMVPGVYRLSAMAEGYTPATLHGAEVARTEEVEVASIPLVPASDQPGVISGAVRNARNGNAMPGVQVQLRSGVGSTGGEPVAVTRSDASGGYRFPNLGAGTYSVTGEQPEFVAGWITGISVGGREVANQDVLMSPEGTENELRIVLSWGDSPRDLDSYLYGPNSAGSRFRLNYGSRGSLTGEPLAALDVDDTNSYGPETVTIVRQHDGVYRYAVHHYAGGGTISTSGAVVQVYRGATLLARFEPPSGARGTGDVWHVFDLQGSRIQAVNRIGTTWPN